MHTMEPKKTPPAGSSGDDAAALQAQVTELTQQLKAMTELAGRAQADLQNAKTRMQRESDDLRKFAAESVLRAFLPILDNFQRAFKHLPKDIAGHEWVKGMLTMEQELWKKLSELGLKRVESLGQQVDTAKHDVVTLGPGKEGEVIDVLDDGYEFHGKILRPAKVRVGDGSVSA